jgi:hypothetical protein
VTESKRSKTSEISSEVFKSQTRIGWNLILDVKLTIEWDAGINAHLKATYILANDMTTEKWVAKRIEQIWKYMMQLGDTRHADEYPDPATNEHLRRAHLL